MSLIKPKAGAARSQVVLGFCAAVILLGVAGSTDAQTATTEAGAAASPAPVSAEAIEMADFQPGPAGKGVSPMLAKLEILLDVSGFSPGAIDGRDGKNLSKAVAAFQAAKGMAVNGELSAEIWQALPHAPVLTKYVITDADVAGPFAKSIPDDYGELAKLKALSYTSPLEMFGERFHMDTNFLTALNPSADFGKPDTTLIVAAVADSAVTTPVAKLIADKTRGQLFGFAEDGTLVVAYPATIGSPETPSPSGIVTITEVDPNPTYHYRPDVNFVQGDNHKDLTIAAGPNNPVGSMWINLSKPTYGIHGTPAPTKIDKTFSHGCVRLTNWDVWELSRLVKKGVTVEFQ